MADVTDRCPLDGLATPELETHLARAHQLSLLDLDDLDQRKAKAIADLAESIRAEHGMTEEEATRSGLRIVRSVPTGGYL
jgi:hypothetical protein